MRFSSSLRSFLSFVMVVTLPRMRSSHWVHKGGRFMYVPTFFGCWMWICPPVLTRHLLISFLCFSSPQHTQSTGGWIKWNRKGYRDMDSSWVKAIHPARDTYYIAMMNDCYDPMSLWPPHHHRPGWKWNLIISIPDRWLCGGVGGCGWCWLCPRNLLLLFVLVDIPSSSGGGRMKVRESSL